MLGLQENGCEGKCLWQVLSKSDEKSEIKNLFCKEKPSFDDNIWCNMILCIVIRWVHSIWGNGYIKIRKSDYVIWITNIMKGIISSHKIPITKEE